MNGKKKSLKKDYNNSLLNDEPKSCSFDDYNEDTTTMIDDEQYNMFLPEKAKEAKDFMDNVFEKFVKNEGPN